MNEKDSKMAQHEWAMHKQQQQQQHTCKRKKKNFDADDVEMNKNESTSMFPHPVNLLYPK